jgi:carotenoid cleavage dioxygenase-like enzyme
MRAQRAYVDDRGMAPASDPSSLPVHRLETVEGDEFGGGEVRGAIPTAMSGRLLAVGAGKVHAVHLRNGQVAERRVARAAWLAGRSAASSGIFVLGRRILAFTHDALAHELDPDLATAWAVDLAGRSQRLIARPRHDPTNGDLHMVATATDGSHAHVVVSAGALTRRSRPIPDAPNEPVGLAVTREHVLFLCDGFVGVTSHDPQARITWIATGVSAPMPVHAHDTGDQVVLHVVTTSLERWIVDVCAGGAERHVIDPGRCWSAGTPDHPSDAAPRFVWTIGEHAAQTHDLGTGRHARHLFAAGRPGDLVFVPDEARAQHPDGGWLVGFVAGASAAGTDLVVLDAADVDGPAVASVPVGCCGSPALRSTWLPDADR